jgi:hypothetical protein
MEQKELFDEVVKYSKNVVPNLRYINDPFFGNGEVGYMEEDLLAVYKMSRLLELNIITKEEFYRLMNLYYEYLYLSNLSNYIFFMKKYNLTDECDINMDDAAVEQLEEKISKIEEELSRYELLPTCMEPIHLIDSSIKHTLSHQEVK